MAPPPPPPLLPLVLLLAKSSSAKSRRSPLGPPALPVLGNLLWLWKTPSNIEPLLRGLHVRYGPVVTLRFGSRRAVFVADRRLAHAALVERGAALADRPVAAWRALVGASNRTIGGSSYGPLWRQLRRNLVFETLHPSRVRLFAPVRSWVLGVLTDKLRQEGAPIVETLQYAMFCLLVLMCFGEKLGEDAVRDIAAVQRDLLIYTSRKLNVFLFAPAITKHLFRSRLETVKAMRRRRTDIYVPLIRARRDYKARGGAEQQDDGASFPLSYVDTLLDMKLPDEGHRALTDEEMVELCSEFLNAGTDTTTTAVQWIMAELVKSPAIQEKLWEEIRATGGDRQGEIGEEDLHRMPYLKAVVLEGLRLHPPGHFVLPHKAAEDTEVGGYVVPKGATVNFMVAEMGRDAAACERAAEFAPERFLEGGDGEGVDITGSREVRMMPFGAGRRVCAGLGVAMLHLEYFVGNLVREFEWKEVEGEEVDFAEKTEFTVVMKQPLRARLLPRRSQISVRAVSFSQKFVG